MRYYIARNAGGVVVDKQVYGGDDSLADALVAKYLANHPGYVVIELDQTTFDATPLPQVQSQAQKDWATFKAQIPAPTALQGILYLARYLGLE